MTVSDRQTLNLRVLILAPTGKDAALTAAVLSEAAIDPLVCPDLACVERAIEEGAGLLLLAEEAIAGGGLRTLGTALSRQPAWSDLPVLLLTRHGADSATVVQAVPALGNVTLLERPVRPATLVSAVRAALKARERQYQIRSHLAERELTEQGLREADRRKDE